MGVVFTQQLKNPHHQRVLFQVDDNSTAFAWELIAAGYKFECELLEDKYVYFNCSGELDGEHQELWSVIVENGPDVPSAIHQLIQNAFAVYEDYKDKRKTANSFC